MSLFVTYISVKPFIKQWLEYHYGSPVVFPPMSAENATIRRFLIKRPNGNRPIIGDESTVTIAIPDSKQKPVITYNYLGKHAKEAVVECIEDTFRIQMWNDLNDLHEAGCSILKGIQAWCEANGISTDYDYTIKMRYQRMRNNYLKNGVDLRLRKRIRDKD